MPSASAAASWDRPARSRPLRSASASPFMGNPPCVTLAVGLSQSVTPTELMERNERDNPIAIRQPRPPESPGQTRRGRRLEMEQVVSEVEHGDVKAFAID